MRYVYKLTGNAQIASKFEQMRWWNAFWNLNYHELKNRSKDLRKPEMKEF